MIAWTVNLIVWLSSLEWFLRNRFWIVLKLLSFREESGLEMLFRTNIEGLSWLICHLRDLCVIRIKVPVIRSLWIEIAFAWNQILFMCHFSFFIFIINETRGEFLVYNFSLDVNGLAFNLDCAQHFLITIIAHSWRLSYVLSINWSWKVEILSWRELRSLNRGIILQNKFGLTLILVSKGD